LADEVGRKLGPLIQDELGSGPVKAEIGAAIAIWLADEILISGASDVLPEQALNSTNNWYLQITVASNPFGHAVSRDLQTKKNGQVLSVVRAEVRATRFAEAINFIDLKFPEPYRARLVEAPSHNIFAIWLNKDTDNFFVILTDISYSGLGDLSKAGDSFRTLSWNGYRQLLRTAPLAGGIV
jgi:hypothetical protein